MGCALCICGCRRAWVNSFRGENFVVASALAHGKFDVRPRGSGLDLMAAASASSAVGVGTSRMHLGAVVTGDTHAHVGIADAHAANSSHDSASVSRSVHMERVLSSIAIGDICSAAVWGAVWGSSSIAISALPATRSISLQTIVFSM
jgi:hypothetical protein